ncbi:Putative NAD(P)-binding domain superfamily [Septoria linicola]|uniref:NAD(P)-binding domain superfamily n=1 Tax=Septoria linicola TaxID=215465 RepID=A0A9Q9ATD2_9PEZI|nr:putative NAD(P)-binding domain superfamily [Septoria linicola]USW52195.1 Putative NAD(P)-binding domain superfamily [Septoria linicola]
MANAGIMAHPPGLTKDGYELQFGTDHMGHALLVKLLTPLLLKTAKRPESKDVRMVWDTSLGHKGHNPKGIEFSKLKTDHSDIVPIYGLQGALGPWVRYAQSKLANLLYARAHAKRYPQITSVSIHPGVSATGLVGGLTWAQKAFVYTTSYMMMIPAEIQVEKGTFYMPVGKKGTTTARGNDADLEQKLWEWTEEELKSWQL